MSIIEFNDVSKVFKKNRENHVVLRNINLKIKKGEFVCIVGSSGCGKTTMLNLILGVHLCTEGNIFVKAREVDKISYDCAVVFQENSLFPWLTVIQNVEFGLKMKGMKKKEREDISLRYLDMVNLKGYKNAFIHELSGGMKQRVALSRALATERDILLLDEPFSALDQNNRKILQLELLKIWESTKKTIIMVTHSDEEALFLADRVIKLCPEMKNIKSDSYINASRSRNIGSLTV